MLLCVPVLSGAQGPAPMWSSELFTKKVIVKQSTAPPTTETPRLQEYLSLDKGLLFHYNLGTYWGYEFNAPGTAPSPAYFNIPSIDMKPWAEAAVASRSKYAGIIACHEMGFQLWPSNVTYADARIEHPTDQHLTPTWRDYTVRGHADQDILEKFCVAMRNVGVEPYFYYNICLNWNVQGAFTPIHITFGAFGDNRRAELVKFWCLQLQELAMRYKVRYLWLDAYIALDPSEHQAFYDAVKAVNPDCMVVLNMGPATTFFNYPGDAMSFENYVVDNPSYTMYKSINKVVGGTTYKIGQEFIASPQTVTSPHNWYNYDQYCVVQPPNPNLVLLSQEVMQSYADSAKLYNVNYLIAPSPDRYGKLPDSQMSRIINLID